MIRTGGLEAAIAMHVLNNFLAYGLALSFGDMTESVNATGPSSPWMIVSTLTRIARSTSGWRPGWPGRSASTTPAPPVGGALPPAAGDPVLADPRPRV